MKSRIFALQKTEISKTDLLGEGNKHVLVVIKKIESQEKILADLIKAIKLDPIKDIFKLIINTESDISISAIIDEFSISKVLTFGVSAKELGYNINQSFYHIYNFENHKLLLSESIDVLQSDKNKKIILWQSLQKMFL